MINAAIKCGIKCGFDFGGDVGDSIQDTALLYLKGGITSDSDGYYFINENGDNAKICKSFCNTFTSVDEAGGDSYLLLNSAESTVTLLNGGTTLYEFQMKLNDLTLEPSSWSKKTIFGNGTSFASHKGIYISQYLNHIRVRLANGTSLETLDSAIEFDTNWHTYGISVNLSTKKLTFIVDGVSVEEQDITLSGTDFATTEKVAKIGSNYGSGEFTISRFRVLKAGSVVFDVPFSTNFGSTDAPVMYDIISGGEFDMRVTTVETQDLYPANLLNGFELYELDDSPNTLRYIPYMTNGTKITPTLTGHTKIGEYPAGNGLNYCESEIFDGTNYHTAAQLTTFPFTTRVSNTDGALITNMFVFSSALTDAQRIELLTFLGYDMPESVIFIGDSITAGLETDTSELTGDILNAQADAKIWSIADEEWQTLSPSNAVQPLVVGQFAPLLNYSFLNNDVLFILCDAQGGALLDSQFLTTGVRITSLKNSIELSIPSLIVDNKYPIFSGVFCSLGTNDANQAIGTPSTRDNFAANLIALQADIRSTIGQNVHWNQLIVLASTADMIIVRNQALAMDLTEQNMSLYSPDELESIGVHPTTAGTLHMGANYFNKVTI